MIILMSNIRKLMGFIESKREYMVVAAVLGLLVLFKVCFTSGTNLGEFIYYIVH
ncbi:MAG: hypothetical protein ILN61_08725 [Lachnospiraceae bacterium]|nr:hypothetical protein [Clostridiales bacterium]MBP5415306.1 hypothetical protein [Lachnospiraceae bacterium]